MQRAPFRRAWFSNPVSNRINCKFKSFYPILKKKSKKHMDRRHSYLPPPITSTTHAPLPFYTYVALVPGLSFQSFKKIISSITLTHCSFKLQTDKRKKRKKKKVSKNIFQVLNNHQLYIISSFSYSKTQQNGNS